ncbi:MAG: hypothetical protein HFJ80_04400, partial [Clostridiales bacterium]|nr:hypothetical protein [Clostridiales bacterium]
MKPTAKRLLAGFLSFCLLLVLYGCSDAFPTLNDRLAVDAIDRTPISYEPDGTTATESSESTEATGESTEPSESTTEPTTTVTDPPPPPDQSVWRDPAKDTPGVVDMTDDEWNEYEEDDPQFPPVQTEPAPPVEDTLPPVSPPPPSDTTSTTEAATATQTTAPSETTGSSAPAPDTTVGTTSGSSSTPESGADSTASTGSSGSGPSSGSSSGSAPETTTTPTETTTTVPKPYTGWYSENGKTYFFNGGSPVTGWQTMGGVR